MKIEVWSDFSCPFCYIGKTRLEKALEATGLKDKVELSYQSFQLNPYAPNTTNLSPSEVFSKEKNVSIKEATDMFTHVSTLFEDEGIASNMDKVMMTNTFDAHRVAKYGREVGLDEKVTARFMKAYFEEGLNLADPKVLENLAVEVGMDREVVRNILESDTNKDIVNQEIHRAQSMGVTGVPFFVFDNKYSLSGAQSQTYFEQALNQIWQEANPLKPLEGADDSAACTDDSCAL